MGMPYEIRSMGAGTELHQLLLLFGITLRSDCECLDHIDTMNQEGPDWCEHNIELIIGWLRTEAERRKLPFQESLGRTLIKSAISNSRRKMKAATLRATENV
jgi:hypothetical protein